MTNLSETDEDKRLLIDKTKDETFDVPLKPLLEPVGIGLDPTLT